MNAQTPTPTPTPDRITAAEIREALKTIQSRIEQTTARIIAIESIQADERNTLDELTKAIETMLHGMKQAAAATPPATFGEMEITAILKSIDKNNKINYMASGAPYTKFGVRVWDEVLPLLGIDPAALEFGNNPISPGIHARVLLGETTNQKTGKVGIGPHKVTGKA